MKKLCNSLALIALLTVGLTSSAGAKSAAIGQPAPDFTLADITGAKHSLSEYKGKVVVLEWVNPLCPFVKKHYESGNIPNLQKSATADGVIWLTINSAAPGKEGDYTPDQVVSWQKELSSAPTAYFRDTDGTVGQLYGAKTTPDMYVINTAGILVYEGAIDSIRSAKKEDLARATNYVAAALTAVKLGQPVAKASTEPYGCSVKY